MNEDRADLILNIRPLKSKTFALHVHSPVGEVDDEFSLPFTMADLEGHLNEMAVIVNAPTKGRKTRAAVDLETLSAEDIGRMLFDALFSPRVLNLMDRCRERSKGQVRLLLAYDPKNAAMADFARLPWEWMRDSENKLLALSTKTTLIRHPKKRVPFSQTELPDPFRVLAVIANPRNEPELHTDRIIQSLEKNLPGKQVTVEYLEPPTYQALQKRVNQDPPFHALHFEGHGGQLGEDWCLAFEDQRNMGDYISGQDLADILDPMSDHLRLVTLVSCDTSRVDQSKKWNPFNGVANALVSSGEIPAVVAMQFPISYPAAFAFTPAFIREIAKGTSLSTAVNIGRQAILAANRQSMEWGGPVLHTWLKDDRLFKQPPSQRLVINTFPGSITPEKKNPDEVLVHEDFCPFFKGHEVVNPGAWSEYMLPRIRNLRAQFNNKNPVQVEGQTRLAVAFALGYELSRTSRFILHVAQFNVKIQSLETWRSDAKPHGVTVARDLETVHAGASDLAVCVAVSRKTKAQVLAHLQKERRCGWLLHLEPQDGPDNEALPNEAVALSMARTMARKIRDEVDTRNPGLVHLFIAAPQAFATLLGHEMNATGKIRIYEHQDTGYAPAFVLGGNYRVEDH